MFDTMEVVNFQVVLSSGVMTPLKSSPSLASRTSTRRTSSPRYLPPMYFSNLQQEKIVSFKGGVAGEDVGAERALT